MATASPFSYSAQPRDIERELRKARDKLVDAIWDEDEEMQKALKRQILRLEMLKELGERYDVDH
jgi:hypothetical protein